MEFNFDNYSEKVKNNIYEYTLKIDSIDRNINNYPNPFNFKVRFNQGDNLSGGGPSIFRRFNNVKYINLESVCIPRYNITKSYNDLGFLISSNSILESNKNLTFILNKGDIIQISNKNYEVLEFTRFQNIDRIIVNKFIDNSNNLTLTNYKRIQLEGTCSYNNGIIKGYNTSFLNLSIGDTVKINKYTVSIINIISITEMVVTKIDVKINDAEIYVLNKEASERIKIINNRKKINILNYEDNEPNDFEIIENDLILINENIYQINSYNKEESKIFTKQELILPFNFLKPIIIKKKLFKNLQGDIIWENGDNYIVGSDANFLTYTNESIIYLEDGPNYAYFKITNIITNNKLYIEELLNNNLSNFSSLNNNKKKLIYVPSYSISESDFSNESYFLLNIDEFKNDTCQGTNTALSEAFAVLYPNKINSNNIRLTGDSNRIYSSNNLQNINSMSISFSYNTGKKMSLDNMNNSRAITNSKSLHNPNNQVILIFKIGVLQKEYNI